MLENNSKYFTYINSFNYHDSPMIYIPLLSHVWLRKQKHERSSLSEVTYQKITDPGVKPRGLHSLHYLASSKMGSTEKEQKQPSWINPSLSSVPRHFSEYLRNILD